MNNLIGLLGDGHARTIRMLADELDTSESDILRQIEYLEHIGVIKKVIGDGVAATNCTHDCSTCSGCPSGGNGKMCKSCLPEGGFKNMGQMWELKK